MARAVGMHALGTCADVRAEILSLKHRGPTSSRQDFFLILFPVVSSLVAVLELAASIHGCDLKHSGHLQLEYPAKPSSRHGFATHGTHDSWQGHWQLFRRRHLAKDSHLIDWQAPSKSIALRVFAAQDSGCSCIYPVQPTS